MTLILALGNREQFIQLSDRRLTLADGNLLTDESDKAIYFVCANARFLIGIAGLARTGTFQTHRWLIESLMACSKPDYNMHEILKRLHQKSTQDFQTFPALRHLSQKNKKLSIIFSGYLDDFDPPLGAFSILTNFQNFDNGQDDNEAWDEFKIIYGKERRPWEGEFNVIQPIGMWQALQSVDIDILQDFLEELKPADAIVGKGVEIMRRTADRPESKGTIGKQITAICLPRDQGKSISTTYHTNVVSYNCFFPAQVRAVSDDDFLAIDNAVVQVDNSNKPGSPLAIPKVSRNAPCPCGSSKKYKFCHGIQVNERQNKRHRHKRSL